jgi:hypothetical protein
MILQNSLKAAITLFLLGCYVSLFSQGFSAVHENKTWYAEAKGYTRQQPKLSLEASHGQAYVDWIDPWSWHFKSCLLYHASRRISFGIGLGFHFDYTGIYPWPSVTGIYGNKSDGFAIGCEIGLFYSEITGVDIWPLTGIYYKNFFVKYMPIFLFYEQEQYFEMGYSFVLKTK